MSWPSSSSLARALTRIGGALLRGVSRLGGPLGPVVTWRVAKRLRPVLTEGTELVTIKARGLRWHLDLRDTLQRHIFYTGGYEHRLLLEVVRRLRSSDIVLDVGANIGAFAMPVAKRLSAAAGGCLIAVEPSTDAFGRLTRHITANGLEERVLLRRVALGSAPANMILRGRGGGAREDSGWRSLTGTGPEVEEVEVIRGDSLLRELGIPRIDVLKVDVEGFEAQVLNGLSDCLQHNPPRLLVVELVERHQRASGGSVDNLIGLMREYGYAGYWVRVRGLVPLPERAPIGNALFVRE